jgi:class 3 adenylate cyclase/tetratricopeptide (TPR) repeat protein
VGWACRACDGDNPAGTRFCGHCGAASAAEEQPPDADDVIERLSRGQVPEAASTTQNRGQRRLVTAMFADISGFTALAEDLDPETVTDIVSAIISELSDVVGRYEGYVDKYAGDALLAFFGAPMSHEDDAERALACALEMHQRFDVMRPNLGNAAQALGLHIGVNSGHAIALVIGSEVRADYSVLGDAINVAQRLESQAPSGETYVGALTERLARRSFALDSIGTLELKGKAEPVPAWRLAGRREVVADEGVVVGRDEERATLRGAFDRLAARTGEVVIVSGYAGVGKTSLIEAARADAAARDLRWLDARGVSYRSGSPYEPIVTLLTTLADEANPEGSGRDKVPAGLERVLVDLGLGAHAAPLVGLLAPTRSGNADVDPEIRRTQLHEAFTALLGALARRGPLVFTAEDIHWADDATVQLLAHVAAQAERVPLLLIVSARSDSDAVNRIRNEAMDATRLTLDGLGDAEMLALVRSLADTIPDATAVSICARARGNPFFAVEMVRAVARGEAVGTSDDLPPTIESALASRLDRLGSEARRIIDLAAAIGADVPLALLRATAPSVDVRNVRLAVKELIESELLEPARDRPDTLQFRHALVQEVAYSRVLRRHARELHLHIADEIELTDGSDGDNGDVLADHLYRADAGERAVNQLLRCAQRAEGVFANDTAILHLRRARELVLRADEAAPSATELTLRLADLSRQVGAYADAGELYRLLLDGAAAVRAACGLAASLRTQGHYRDALAVLDAARPEIPTEHAAVSLERGCCLMVADSFRAAMVALAEGLAVVPDDDPMRATLLSELARAESSVGLLEGALVHGLEARRAFEQSGDLRGLSTALRVLGGVYEDLGRLDEAAAVLREGRALSERIGHVEEAAGCLVNLALVELARGEIDAAIDCNRRAIDELARIGHPALATANANLAEALLARGAVDEVGEYCDRAMAIAMESGDMLTVADAGLTSALADQRCGRTAQARAAAERAGAHFVEVGSVEWAAKAFTIAAECCEADGDVPRANELRDQAATVISGTSVLPPRPDTTSPTQH